MANPIRHRQDHSSTSLALDFCQKHGSKPHQNNGNFVLMAQINKLNLSEVP
jgi:hypothetical protein